MAKSRFPRRRRGQVFSDRYSKKQIRRNRRCFFEPLEARQILAAVVAGSFQGLVNSVDDGGGQLVGPLAPARPMFSDVDLAFRQVSRLERYSQEQLLDTEQWVVRAAYDISADALAAAAGVTGLEEITQIGSTFLYTVQDGETPGEVISSFEDLEYVEYFYPLVREEITQRFVPNDPLLDRQWHLINTGDVVTNPDDITDWATWGEDIRVEPVWDEYTGEGVVIAIVDDSLQWQHPDIAPNYSPALSTDFAGQDNDPSPDLVADFHGTAVAGIAAGAGNNGRGITGVAYDATIAGVRLLARVGLTDFDIFTALSYLNDQIDVYNNSYGPAPVSRDVNPFGPLATDAVLRSATTGRNGLGNIHIMAAGNGAGAPLFNSSNFSGFTNSRYSIAVGAIGHKGVATSYSEGGANVFVVAPSGTHSVGTPGTNFSRGSGIVTTDLMGDRGYNRFGTFFGDEPGGRDFLLDTDYTTRFNGTSASAPIVTGVVALMLEANPNLSYRDVEHILARSSRQNSPTDLAWQVNWDPITVDPLPPPWDFMLGAPTSMPDPTFPGSALPEIMPRLTNSQGFIPLLTNSSGFMVHDGQDYAYGHGAVDARLAVELAKNWQVTTPIEASIELPRFLTPGRSGLITGAFEIPDSGGVVVPGAISPPNSPDCDTEGFYDLWWNGPDPDEEPPDPMPVNCRGTEIPIFVPDTLSIEHVEVELTFRDLPPEVSDNLRITLVSPEGTHSDFVNWVADPASRPAWNLSDADGSPLNAFTWRFTTARHWGERTGSDLGNPWRLVFSNWVGDEAELESYKVDFFGTDLTGRPGRIQGLVGIDANSDEDFNFTGLINPDTLEYVRDIGAEDPTSGQFFQDFAREPLASEAIVYVDLDRDAFRDPNEPFYMTGADGNYYFDLPFGNYMIRVDAPPGMDVVGDSSYEVQLGAFDPDTGLQLTRARHRDFLVSPELVKFEGTIYADLNGSGQFERLIDDFAHDFVVYVDLNGDGELNFQDRNFNLQFDPHPHLADINLDRTVDRADGDIIRQNMGTLFGATRDQGDTDGDGDVDGRDLLNWLTGFGDMRDIPLEPMDITDLGGNYSIEIAPDLEIDPMTFTGFRGYRGSDFYTVLVKERPGWNLTHPAGPLTSPDGPFYRMYQVAGETTENLDFFFDPDLSDLVGVLYNDTDGDGFRDPFDPGLAGFTVYLDLDENGQLGLGEPQTVTDANGAYRFEDVDPGLYQVHLSLTVQQRDIWAQIEPVATPACPAPACIELFPEVTTSQDFGLHRKGTVYGIVYHDLNGDGDQDAADPPLAGVTVFADLNNDGIVDDGEPRFITPLSGRYEIIGLEEGTHAIRTVAPAGFGFTQPSTGVYLVNVTPDVLNPFNFGVEEERPFSAIEGIVFHDLNTNTRHDEGEPLLPGYVVYVDVNSNGMHDADEPFGVTNTRGEYAIDRGGLPNATYTVRVRSVPGLQTQTPYIGSRFARLDAFGAQDINFWVGDTTTVDVGSAPPPYPDATHRKPVSGTPFVLGTGFANDGVGTFVGGEAELFAGQTYTIQVTANRAGAFLQAWIDYNGDGDWSDTGERVFTNRALTVGANSLTFTVPAGATGGETYARFRLSEMNLNSPTAEASVGEVEDYPVVIITQAAAAQVAANLEGALVAAAEPVHAAMPLDLAIDPVSDPGGQPSDGSDGSVRPQVVTFAALRTDVRDAALAELGVADDRLARRAKGSGDSRSATTEEVDSALAAVLDAEVDWLT